MSSQPRINHNLWMLIYIISFILIVGFFVINMFVGVVVENFHRCREEHEREEIRRREERRLRKLERQQRKRADRQSDSAPRNNESFSRKTYQLALNGAGRVRDKMVRCGAYLHTTYDRCYKGEPSSMSASFRLRSSGWREMGRPDKQISYRTAAISIVCQSVGVRLFISRQSGAKALKNVLLFITAEG